MTVRGTLTHEKRFVILEADPSFRMPDDALHVSQCYFGDDTDIEVRVITENDGSASATVTVKHGHGVSRTKDVHHAALETARFMLKATRHRIEKRRAFDGPWIIDQLLPPYSGIMVKIRLTHPDQPFAMLPWMRAWRDVTGTLTNRVLAQGAMDLTEDASNMPIRDTLDRRRPLVALTGGPLSGKTKVIEMVRAEFGEWFHCGEEAVTILSTKLQAKPPQGNRRANRRYQRMVYRVQLGFEDACVDQAVADGKLAVLCDRGTPDGIAYLQDGVPEFEHVTGTTRQRELARYAAVLFLDSPSAAVFEAERHNNEARYESDYAANLAVAARTFAAWEPHPWMLRVPSTETFAEKLDVVRTHLRQVVAAIRDGSAAR